MSNRIYRKIWESVYGEIPVDEEGRSYEIHHIDGNHLNNDINNLKCVSIKEHYDIHYKQGDYAACHMIAKRMAKTPEELSNIISNLNRKRTGDKNPFYGKTHTEETRQKLREKNSGKNNYWYGKKRPDHGEKVSKALKGKSKKPEHIKSMSESRKGNIYKKYKWKLKHNDNEIVIENLKNWCKEKKYNYNSFYSGKEYDGYKLIGRVKS